MNPATFKRIEHAFAQALKLDTLAREWAAIAPILLFARRHAATSWNSPPLATKSELRQRPLTTIPERCLKFAGLPGRKLSRRIDGLPSSPAGPTQQLN